MATTEQLAHWEQTLTETDALYREVAANTAAQGEVRTDLSGSVGSGGSQPMPGGDRVASVAVFNEHAPADPERFPHPLQFLYTWSWHCAAAAASLPPRRAWEPALDYLRAHMHWIDGHDTAAFEHDLRRVHGNLRRLCNVDRRSQAEEVWIGKQNEKNARKIIRDLVERDALPEWIHPKGKRYREPLMVTREEGASVYPELADPLVDEFYGTDPDDKDRVDAAWNRIANRTQYWTNQNYGENRKRGHYKLEFVAHEAAKITRW